MYIEVSLVPMGKETTSALGRLGRFGSGCLGALDTLGRARGVRDRGSTAGGGRDERGGLRLGRLLRFGRLRRLRFEQLRLLRL